MGMVQKVLWEKVLQDMHARRHLYAPFVVCSYMELLNGLRNPDGWTTEMGDVVCCATVVFTVHDANVVRPPSPPDGVLDNGPPLNVAYVNRAHFMHVQPRGAHLPAHTLTFLLTRNPWS